MSFATDDHIIDTHATTLSVRKDIIVGGNIITPLGVTHSKSNLRYTPMMNPMFFDLTSLPASVDLVGYRACFTDSVWMYLVPNQISPGVLSSKTIRIQLKSLIETNDFATDVPVTERIDLSVYNPLFAGFSCGTTDGLYAYYLTGYNAGFTAYGFLVRVPVSIAWSSPGIASSIMYLDLTGYNASLAGFTGCLYDNGNLYLIPCNNGSPILSGLSARVSVTQANWTAITDPQALPVLGVTTVDLRSIDAQLCGFYGGVITPTHIYYIPYYNGVYSGKIARIPTTNFTLSGIETLNLATVSSILTGFRGGVYDGRYIYLAPYYNDRDPINYPGQIPDYHGKVPRIDTELFSLDTVVYVDLQGVASTLKGFDGLTCDVVGRYLYLCPSQGLTASTVARIDLSRFTDASVVRTIQLTDFNGSAIGYTSATSFREFVFLVPTGSSNGNIARFRTN